MKIGDVLPSPAHASYLFYSLSKILHRGERNLGFSSPDHLWSSFPFIGLRLWVEEASSVLLRRLCFSGKRLSSLSPAYSGFFSGSVRSRPICVYLLN
ncbi:hypothetical protein YC2023_075734 [Brassica napus]